jgi:predicted 3-demethylubiquinone-9 3-methyltransferase (glyoxalase superfamily)
MLSGKNGKLSTLIGGPFTSEIAQARNERLGVGSRTRNYSEWIGERKDVVTALDDSACHCNIKETSYVRKEAMFRLATGAHTHMPKNTICVWYDKDAEAAARFYAATFPDSTIGAVHRAPSDFPGGKKGDALVVDFTVAGVACIGLNGGSTFKQTEAFSFQIATDGQEETDRYWNAIVGNGGQESECGWCKDKWGVSWQITPKALTEGMAAGGDEAKRVFEAMMTMQKIDVATIEKARRG